MDPNKLHILVTILLTQAAAVYTGRAPFFHIEVSRTAASGALPLWIFRIGAASSILTLLATKSLSVQHSPHLFAWVALVMIAVFDDGNWPVMHFVGIGVLALTACYALWLRGGTGGVFAITALLIWILRLVLKVGVVAWYELDKLPMGNMRTLIRLLTSKAMHIMHGGTVACRDPASVIPVFQVCAVLQWVAFYALSHVF
jgi:hypothetical protein